MFCNKSLMLMVSRYSETSQCTFVMQVNEGMKTLMSAQSIPIKSHKIYPRGIRFSELATFLFLIMDQTTQAIKSIFVLYCITHLLLNYIRLYFFLVKTTWLRFQFLKAFTKIIFYCIIVLDNLNQNGFAFIVLFSFTLSPYPERDILKRF